MSSSAHYAALAHEPSTRIRSLRIVPSGVEARSRTMITAVDTNVLLDALLPDPAFGPASKEALRIASRQGALIICEVVYAELAGFFPKAEAIDVFLQQTGIQLRPSEPQTLWRAGYLWRQFCLRRPQRSEVRRRVLADFLVGAHAMLQAEQLLTRDKGFYRSVFAELRVG